MITMQLTVDVKKELVRLVVNELIYAKRRVRSVKKRVQELEDQLANSSKAEKDAVEQEMLLRQFLCDQLDGHELQEALAEVENKVSPGNSTEPK